MSDRFNALLVIFEEEIHEDDIHHWVAAITLMRKVLKVEQVDASKTYEHQAAKEQALQKLRDEMMDFLYPWRKKK